MRVSYHWLSELVDLNGQTPEAVAKLLTARGMEVEDVESEGKGLEKVIAAHILEKGKHPDSDKLSYCKVDTGSGVLDIVCGAQNHKTGDKVCLAMIGAELPNGMKIGKGKIRGVESHGMLCSEVEMGLAKESAGIMILPPDTVIGTPIAKVLGKTDTVFTLKLYANQSHCLSHVGVARELAAEFGQTVKLPALKAEVSGQGSPIAIALEAGDKAPQFFGMYIEGVKIAPSPAWLVKRLETLGQRSINNVVDATNLVLLETGHPVHAYDAAKIAGAKIGVRISGMGEKLPLLDGSEITMTGTELEIFDGSGKGIGLAGVMGGGNSEVSDATTKVFLECAQFDPVLVRRAKQKHQKMTEAAARFEKGIDPEGLSRVIARLATLVLELAGGKILGSGIAQHEKPAARPTIEVATGWIQSFLGLTGTDHATVVKKLQSLACKVEESAGSLRVTPPSYRLDLNIREDLAEEVARTVGYDKIPSTIPPLSGMPQSQAWSAGGAAAMLLTRAKQSWVRSGFNETLNLGFASAGWLGEFGLPASVRVINPLSADHEIMVPSLIPGLVANAQNNWNHHFGSETPAIRLFEIRPTFHAKKEGEIQALSDMDTGVEEKWRVAFALSGPRYAAGLRSDLGLVDFYDVKAAVEAFLGEMGTKGVRLLPAHQSRTPDRADLKILHPGQSVEVLAGGQVAGSFGQLHPGIAKRLKLKHPLWIGEFDWDAIRKLSRPAPQARTYAAWSEFPAMERDYAFLVANDVTADKLVAAVLKAGKPLAREARVFDVYSGAQVPEGKRSVAVRAVFSEPTRSLTEAETDQASQAIIAAIQKEFAAELR